MSNTEYCGGECHSDCNPDLDLLPCKDPAALLRYIAVLGNKLNKTGGDLLMELGRNKALRQRIARLEKELLEYADAQPPI